jgi:hypothetical protein
MGRTQQQSHFASMTSQQQQQQQQSQFLMGRAANQVDGLIFELGPRQADQMSS